MELNILSLPRVQFNLNPSQRKFVLQRHLFLPSLVVLQVEFGESLQSNKEEKIGSKGGPRFNSISIPCSLGALELKMLGSA
ncbi:hypothetical protein Fmac_021733 [Flemingia macrophylla]|uniref:Uncharacterized protein n=1 Tax=Flemingia macrophylla TaxID=520843 RepID=A0ABD1LXU4_9FABA